MRIGFISKGSLAEFTENGEKTPPDLYVFGFDGAKEISYERELKGETVFFEEAARLSKRAKNTIVCGCITDTLGHKRKSVLVAENGKLLGVSDMLNAVDGEVSSGASLRIYSTKIGKMGVIVAEDLLFPDLIKALVTCGSDFIVCPFGKTDGMQRVLLRAEAYLYGVPILFCAEGYCAVATVSGELAFASSESPVEWDCPMIKEYHLVETRKRGVWVKK